MALFTKTSLCSTRLRNQFPSDRISVLRRNRRKGKGGRDAGGEAQRQKGRHRQSRRTLLVCCNSLLRLIGQWWGTWDTGVSQMVEDVATSHLPLGCDPTHLAKNIPPRHPKWHNQHLAVQPPHLVVGCWLKAACLLRRTAHPPPSVSPSLPPSPAPGPSPWWLSVPSKKQAKKPEHNVTAAEPDWWCTRGKTQIKEDINIMGEGCSKRVIAVVPRYQSNLSLIGDFEMINCMINCIQVF